MSYPPDTLVGSFLFRVEEKGPSGSSTPHRVVLGPFMVVGSGSSPVEV